MSARAAFNMQKNVLYDHDFQAHLNSLKSPDRPNLDDCKIYVYGHSVNMCPVYITIINVYDVRRVQCGCRSRRRHSS